MTRRVSGLLVAALLVCLALAGAAGATGKGDPLPSWREPLKSQLLEYVSAVSWPGGKDFIPPAERIASFDLDGTLIPEQPLPFVMDVSLAYLHASCPGFAKAGPRQADLCALAKTANRKELYFKIEDVLALPFAGWDLDAYRTYARRIFETAPTKLQGRPLCKLVYQPQLELMALLRQKGFTVWVCTGSAIAAVQAISADYLGVPPSRCIGTRYALRVEEQEGRMLFRRGEVMPGLVNLGRVKAANLKLATMYGPVLAFGNSGGDEFMLRYAVGSKHRGLALVLNHDDPREFVYAKPDLLKLAQERGWSVVSMKRDWARVFKP